MNTSTRLAFVAPLLLALACGHKAPPPAEDPAASALADAEAPPPEAPKSLFERLGGETALHAIVDTFSANLVSDKRFAKSHGKLKGPKLEAYKAALYTQLCEAAGGDCKIEGTPVKDAHKGMKLSDAQWEAFTQDFALALDENKAGEAEKADLTALLATLKADVLSK